MCRVLWFCRGRWRKKRVDGGIFFNYIMVISEVGYCDDVGDVSENLSLSCLNTCWRHYFVAKVCHQADSTRGFFI